MGLKRADRTPEPHRANGTYGLIVLLNQKQPRQYLADEVVLLLVRRTHIIYY